MDVIGTVMSVTQTLLAALQCSELKEFSSMFGYKSQLDDLQRTVNTVKAIFRDAEAKQELSEVEQQLINELKDVIFEADDLLDEFVTLAEQKQLLKDHGSRSEKMRLFINRLNPHGIPHKMSEGVKKIRKRLDAIARIKQLSFEHDPQPIRNRKSETCSYACENEIIGREKELKEIIDMLLNSDVQHKVSFLSIVGIGGLGKTALAQVVYNDPRITSAFPLKMWTCISDQEQKQLDVAEVLLKILASAATDNNFDQGSTLDWVQFQLREKLAGKKYLLVLDDVWTEDRVQWFELEKYLIGGQEGSWILVTTRSERTASIVGDGRMYRLQGLSVENSWQLFKKAAFKPDASNPPNNLLEIGREIVDRCARVPLAIKVVGSLLYGQDSVKWESFQKIGLANIMEGENNIMPILKLSYYHLEYPLKSCFSYCAIYPKDYEIKKETLKSLWMAQGYIVPLYTGQSIEDACEQYFSTLLKRCFFQDIQENEAGEIYSVKIHDLIHDVAQSVSKNEIYAARTFSRNLDANVCRHLSISHTLEFNKYILRKSRMRTYLCVDRDHGGLFQIDDLEVIVASYGNLRALGIPGSRIKTLPESTGKLLHLRYLDLSRNIKLEVLPKSITKLCNLQTFLLQGCRNLEELPKDLSRLIKLRVLDITGCHGLSYIPKGMNKLTCINRLSDFIVGGEKSCLSWTEWFVQLEELKALNNLRGNLNVTIKWPENIKNVCQDVLKRRGLYLKNKVQLTEIYIRFDYQESDRRLNDEDCFKLMEDLHPPSNLLWLSVWEYPGTRMPKWIFLLKRLVTLKLYKCKELEYIEACGSAEEEPFLPFLEKLKLYSLPKLKGWKRGGVEVEDSNNSQSQLLPRLPRLKKLKINRCPKLTCIPLYPSMKQLFLFHFNKNLKGIIKTESDDKSVEVNEFLKLREVEIDDLKWLSSLPVEALQCLENLKINRGEEVQSLGELKEVLRACCSSLQFLRIDNCHKLSIVARELGNLSALEELTISYCDVDMAIITSPSFLPCLRSLKLEYLPKMVNLPNWIQFLPALQILHIEFCKGLKAMPNWMCKLTSLKQLNVSYCSKTLEKRCKEDPVGDDWPYIQHISNIQICRCIYN